MPDAPAGDALRDAANDAEARLLNHGPSGWGADAKRFIKAVERLRAAARAEGAAEQQKRDADTCDRIMRDGGDSPFAVMAQDCRNAILARAPSSGTEAQP